MVRGTPPAVREVALALAARAVDGPAVLPGPPEGPVLVLAPHPDDETIGCGGALARHRDRGDDVTVVVATSGEATGGGRGDVAAVRESECAAACRELGLASAPVFLRLPDGHLAGQGETLAAALADLGRAVRVVYAPSVLDPHRDHAAANAALALAGLDADVYGYEVWSPGPVDVLLDVTGVVERKERALACYRTALESVDYVRATRGLAAYRSAGGGLAGAGFAEGFLRLTAGEHASFVRSTARAGS